MIFMDVFYKIRKKGTRCKGVFTVSAFIIKVNCPAVGPAFSYEHDFNKCIYF